ncbi:MAG: ferritin-like domain-containing protein [Candidatus Bathyarchaeota archaeon]|nr:ferritin-like domain-containing protein [Candidatus Bathyarchaeota archaeon]
MSKQNEKKVLEFIKKQILTEKEIVDSVNSGIKNIKNPPVKGVLKGISLDSMKHAELYASAVTLLTTVSQALTQENLDEQRALVEKHIKIEAELIKKLEEELPHIENKKVAFLLKAILADERRHHALLKKVLEIIVHAETITEEDWWKILWEEVPFHGAPGG